MNIQIVTHSKLVQAVNARDLHVELESDTQFSHWIQRRIEEYGFIENQDYCLVSQKRVTKTRGGNRNVV